MIFFLRYNTLINDPKTIEIISEYFDISIDELYNRIQKEGKIYIQHTNQKKKLQYWILYCKPLEQSFWRKHDRS